MKDSLVYKLFEMLVGELEGAIASKDLGKIREIFEISDLSNLPLLDTQTNGYDRYDDEEGMEIKDWLESLIDLNGGDRHEGI